MSFVGHVSYASRSRRFALITPLGKRRTYDIFGHEIWWHLARIPLPFPGQFVSFDVSETAEGAIEAVHIRLATQSSGIKNMTTVGAERSAGRFPQSRPADDVQEV